MESATGQSNPPTATPPPTPLGTSPHPKEERRAVAARVLAGERAVNVARETGINVTLIQHVDNRWVNLLGDPDDYHVILLASMGMSYKVIAQQTGLSFGQISYRLRRANEHRKPWDKISAYNFRNGVSESSQAVIHLAAKRVAQIIEPSLRRNLAVDIGYSERRVPDVLKNAIGPPSS